MAYGDKPKRQKDDMGNKGRKSGKGPKPMKGSGKARRESAKQERKNLKTENPVVNRSNDSGFDYTQSKKDIKKRYKKMDKGGSAPAAANIPHGTVARFQGSTKPLGDTKAMNAMMQKTIKAGLSADLGGRIAKAAMDIPMTDAKLPSMEAPVIKKPLGKKISKVAPVGELIETSVAKTTGSFKPSKRDMELKAAHLGNTMAKRLPQIQSASPSPLNMRQAEGPKPQKPKSKSQKPKRKKKRVIKAKF